MNEKDERRKMKRWKDWEYWEGGKNILKKNSNSNLKILKKNTKKQKTNKIL